MTPAWRARAVPWECTTLQRASSRANGIKFRRPRKVDDSVHMATAKRMKTDGPTAKHIARFLGVSRATVPILIRDGTEVSVRSVRSQQYAGVR